MTTAENIKFIEEQLSTFEALRSDTLRVLRALSARRGSILSSIQQTRRDIRSTRDSLTSRSAAPSLVS
jgi:hypothetical protein